MSFLTDTDITRLTGYEPNQRKRIAKCLTKKGIPFDINARGDVVVLWSDVEQRKTGNSEPNLGWITGEPQTQR